MSKINKNEAPHYELLYLISNQFSEDELQPITSKAEKIITDNDGAITLRQSIGKKKLAYKIKQFRHGYYELVEFDAPADALPKINEQFRLSSDILRHQIIKTEPKTPEQLAKEAKIISELSQNTKEEAATKTPEETKNKKETTKSLPKNETENKKTEKKETDKPKDSLSDSDLDDKLNQILDTNNLL